jgi:transcriptional regulator with XRE-family HTH domain
VSRPTKGGKEYDRAAFAAYLEGLRQERNESYREASMAAGLDHGAMRRYIREKQRPTRESCIALADHFGVNPNELLTRAGYEAMHFFDRSLVDPSAYPPEVEEVASCLARMKPASRRREVCRAVRELLEAASRTTRAR